MSELNLSDKIIIREGATIMLVSSDALKVEDVREAVKKLIDGSTLSDDWEGRWVSVDDIKEIFGEKLTEVANG